MLFSGNSYNTPPASDEIEISVFGPGFGECVIAHLGRGDWIVVDSFINSRSKNPVAIDYFGDLGVPLENVVLTVATHWDTDHIRGLTEVLLRCEKAHFCTSAAMSRNEFFTLLGHWKNNKSLSFSSGLDEMQEIYAILAKRSTRNYPAAKRATAKKDIWERFGELPARIKSLSPSDAAELIAISRWNEITAELKSEGFRRFPRLDNNDASVVLSLQVGSVRILLGGDLEMRDDRALGWFAIVDDWIDPLPHDSYKIPHHGSHNGDHPEIWTRLVQNPVVVVTPYNKGSKKLPTNDDCKRITAACENAYITSPPRPKKFSPEDRAIGNLVRQCSRSANEVASRNGLVRLRKKAVLGEQWNVELFGEATRLNELIES